MKRVVLFALLVVSLDAGLGWAFGQLYRRTFTGGRGGLLNYALTKDTDVLVLGSSRAQYQVMPTILRQRLSMTAFNAGLLGQDFLYSVMLYDLWKRSHPAPRAVLLQIDIESLLKRESELEGVQILSPYLGESALIREVLYSADPYKRFEYWSRAYRYNGKAFSIARNLFAHPDFESDGFIPAIGTFNPVTDATVTNALDQDATALEQAEQPFWDRKVRYLRELAEDVSRQHGRLFLFHTPLYAQDAGAHRIWAGRINALLDHLPGVEFIDICEATHPETFAGRPALYHDVNHLNAQGAIVLTNLLADELKGRLVTDSRADGSASHPQRHCC
jgi:hypothetical protein